MPNSLRIAAIITTGLVWFCVPPVSFAGSEAPSCPESITIEKDTICFPDNTSKLNFFAEYLNKNPNVECCDGWCLNKPDSAPEGWRVRCPVPAKFQTGCYCNEGGDPGCKDRAGCGHGGGKPPWPRPPQKCDGADAGFPPISCYCEDKIENYGNCTTMCVPGMGWTCQEGPGCGAAGCGQRQPSTLGP